MKRRIALLGAPAAGKGTQAELIEARWSIPVTSPGAMLREETRRKTSLGLQAARLTSDGKLLPDEIVTGLLRGWLAEHNGEFVLDGFPRTLGQADALAEILDGHGTPLQVVIALEVTLEVVQERVAGRLGCRDCGCILSLGLHVESATSLCPKCGGPLRRRADDFPETLAARLVQYAEKTEPLLNYYRQRQLLEVVDSTRSPDLVFQSVSAILEAP